MNYTPEQISEIVLKDLKEVNEHDVLTLSLDEKRELAKNPNYKLKTLELTQVQYDALKTLVESSQVESIKTLTL